MVLHCLPGFGQCASRSFPRPLLRQPALRHRERNDQTNTQPRRSPAVRARNVLLEVMGVIEPSATTERIGINPRSKFVTSASTSLLQSLHLLPAGEILKKAPARGPDRNRSVRQGWRLMHVVSVGRNKLLLRVGTRWPKTLFLECLGELEINAFRGSFSLDLSFGLSQTHLRGRSGGAAG